MSVCQFTAAALTKKHHKVLHETKMDFSRTLSNLEKFWFSRKIRIWELHSPKILIGMKQLWWANCSLRLHKCLFSGFNSPLPWQRQHGLFPKILQHPQLSGGSQPTQPSTSCLGTNWEALWDWITPGTIWAIPEAHGAGEATPEERLTLISLEPPQSLRQFQHIF